MTETADDTATDLLVTATITLPLSVLRPFDDFDVTAAVDSALSLVNVDEIRHVEWEEIE